ncbi:hypothetical protein KAT08_03625 [Candidatus Babeliales bacterium]|nr:hypothetical protein [Candidatus Babeliales bacterium]
MNKKVLSLICIVGIGMQVNIAYSDNAVLTNEELVQEEFDTVVEENLQKKGLKQDQKCFNWETFLEGAGAGVVVAAVPLAILSVYFKSCINELKSIVKSDKEFHEELKEKCLIKNAGHRGSVLKIAIMKQLEEVINKVIPKSIEPEIIED